MNNNKKKPAQPFLSKFEKHVCMCAYNHMFKTTKPVSPNAYQPPRFYELKPV